MGFLDSFKFTKRFNDDDEDYEDENEAVDTYDDTPA